MLRNFVRPARRTSPGERARHARAGHRLVLAVVGVLGAAAVMAACDGRSTAPLGVELDPQAPTISISQPEPAPDSNFVEFTVQADDNLGLYRIQTDVSGPGFSGGFDTTFTSAVTSTNYVRRVAIPAGTPAGDTIMVIGVATDGAFNHSAPDTARLLTPNQIP